MAKAATTMRFKLWRKEMGISMKESALFLGKKAKTVELYRDGYRTVPVSTIYLMQALSTGWRPTLIEREHIIRRKHNTENNTAEMPP